MENFERRALRGFSSTIVIQALCALTQIITTAVLARLLTPEDFGLIAMLAPVLAFAGLFRELGLSSAAIQVKELSNNVASSLFIINALAGALLTLLLIAISPLVAYYYNRPELSPLLMVASCSMLVASFGSQPAASLLRDLRFEAKASAPLFGYISFGLAAWLLALTGVGVWSLALAQVVQATVVSVTLICFSRFRLHRPSFGKELQHLLGFGGNVAGFSFVNFFHRNFDNLLIGKFMGAEPLGVYSRAYSLLMFPMNSIKGAFGAVLFSTLSRLLDDRVKYADFLLKAFYWTSVGAFALGGGAVVFADDLVLLILGEQWRDAIGVFRALGVAAVLQPLGIFRGQILLSQGKSGEYFRWGVVNAVLTIIAFCIGLNFGLIGVSVSYSLAVGVIFLPSLWYATLNSPVSFLDLICEISVPGIATIVAVLLTFVLRTASNWSFGCLVVYVMTFGACLMFSSRFRCVASRGVQVFRR